MDVPKDLKRFDSLVEIIATLRGPQGCPWDKKQTHSSLREHLLEESYEVLEALDEANTEKLCAELGDLLLQIVLHAQVGKEAGEFDIGDVVEGINQKLLHRHPHVFGSACAKNADEVLVHWEELKKQERKEDAGMLDGVPKALPSLSYSQSVQDRVARVGFDWPDDDGVIEKLAEEITEFKQSENQQEKSDEFGDILFTLANYARRQGIDLESALREANHKFSRRFAYMEKLCRERKLDLSKMTLDEQNKLWDEAKEEVG
jgi:tetrapyrrole methylase family protein / MazG family protein